MSTPAQWLWMQRLFGVGTARAHRAREYCGDPEEILALSAKRLSADGWLNPKEKREILSPDLETPRRLLEQAQDLGFRAVTPESPEYPLRLGMIPSPPLVLFAKGDLSLLTDPYPIAMVGTRYPDDYGKRAARKIATEIAGLGGTVVSGLAVGVDSVCHRSALDVGGHTVAFLAAGPDSEYPKANAALRREVEERGLLLTEFPVGVSVRSHSFHIRNRLLSGISLATVVVQAPRRSGSLITAGHALAQDRDVYAVCGSIFSLKMEGCHGLLSEGAAPVFSGTELMERYAALYGVPPEPVADPERIAALANPREEPSSPPARSGGDRGSPKAPRQEKAAPGRPVSPSLIASLTGEQERVYAACGEECGADELCARTGLAAPRLMSTLTQLEIFGLVETLPGGRVRRV